MNIILVKSTSVPCDDNTLIPLINEEFYLLFFKMLPPLLSKLPPYSFIDFLDFSTLLAYSSYIVKVRTFWETHKIWKNLPHGFDKSADLLSKRQNHEEDFFKLCVLLKKSEL